ncbi:MAG TPA: class I SAM-dependent methyltransferase [Polyangiaceae bacterium]|jgi:predicted O-methyltransferase YrrM|nr:class I SAM-dependent methyltransferase [Polyangiaceae bacterium]
MPGLRSIARSFRPIAFARRLLRRWGVAAEQRTTFSSFRRYLPDLLRWAAPARVLEFGPGFSSRLILDNSAARILSFETHPGYYERARRDIVSPRFELRLAPAGPDFATLVGERFDFIFVDGGDRVKNLEQSVELLSEDGIVVLHDAHREGYEPGVLRYARGYFIENHSLLLCNNPSRFEQVKARFPADGSCNCKYCGTPARVAYRRRIAEALGGSARA